MSDFELPFPIDSISSHFGPRLINPETGDLIPLWSDQLALSRGVWQEHDGCDYRQLEGTPVRACAGGTVSRVAENTDDEGYAIWIQHGEHGAILTHSAHLRGLPLFQEGQAVNKGDIIGYVGSTGNSTAPHLHLGVHVRGVPYNPLTVADKWEMYRSVNW